jgi:hypothetical protein
MRPRALQTEEIGEAYRRCSPKYQNSPKDPGDDLLGCDQAHPSCVRQSLYLVKAFCVELLVGRRAWLDLLKVRSVIVYEGPPSRSSLPLLHQRPLFIDHLLGLGSGEFLEVGTFWFGESMGQPEDLGHRIGLLLDRATSLLVFPHTDRFE